jgi:hypothetical protein
VVAHPSSPTAESFMELGAGLVREVAKMQRQQRNAVRCPHAPAQASQIPRPSHSVPAALRIFSSCVDNLEP